MIKKIFKILSVLLLIPVVLVIGYCALNYHADIPVTELKAKYANSESKFIDIDGTQVHYRDEGNPQDAVPVVLLHGNASNLMAWDGWTAELKKEHRVIRLDIPGFGLTGPSAAGDHSTAGLVGFLDKFLSKLNVSKCYLAGNSMGGKLSWEYALAHPEKIEKLILVDASGYPSERGIPLPFKLARTPIVNKLLLWVTPRSLIEKSLKEVYFDDSKVTDELVTQYFEMALREGNRAAFVARANAADTNNYQRIGEIKAPVLVLWGAEDAWTPADDAKKFEHDLPNDKVIVYKDLGHMPMLEDPVTTVKDAAEFLRPAYAD